MSIIGKIMSIIGRQVPTDCCIVYSLNDCTMMLPGGNHLAANFKNMCVSHACHISPGSTIQHSVLVLSEQLPSIENYQA